MDNKAISKSVYFWLSLVASLLFCPHRAYADGISPAFLKQSYHLLVFNFLIGILEGLIISSIFHTSKKRSILIMVLANYASMILGMFFMLCFAFVIPLTLQHYPLNDVAWNTITLFLTFILTNLIEWPFVYRILKNNEKRFVRSIWGTLVVNLISYALIILFYVVTWKFYFNRYRLF